MCRHPMTACCVPPSWCTSALVLSVLLLLLLSLPVAARHRCCLSNYESQGCRFGRPLWPDLEEALSLSDEEEARAAAAAGGGSGSGSGDELGTGAMLGAAKLLGRQPGSALPVYIKRGPFGLYVQLVSVELCAWSGCVRATVSTSTKCLPTCPCCCCCSAQRALPFFVKCHLICHAVVSCCLFCRTHIPHRKGEEAPLFSPGGADSSSSSKKSSSSGGPVTRASLPRSLNWSNTTLEHALQLLALPRMVGLLGVLCWHHDCAHAASLGPIMHVFGLCTADCVSVRDVFLIMSPNHTQHNPCPCTCLFASHHQQTSLLCPTNPNTHRLAPTLRTASQSTQTAVASGPTWCTEPCMPRCPKTAPRRT